jgi:hypothetical protein
LCALQNSERYYKKYKLFTKRRNFILENKSHWHTILHMNILFVKKIFLINSEIAAENTFIQKIRFVVIKHNRL